MDTLYISGLSIKGYGVFLAAGIGFLINVKDKTVLQRIIDNEQKIFEVYDLADKKIAGSTTYESLKNEYLNIKEHNYKSCSLTSIYMAEKIAEVVVISEPWTVNSEQKIRWGAKLKNKRRYVTSPD